MPSWSAWKGSGRLGLGRGLYSMYRAALWAQNKQRYLKPTETEQARPPRAWRATITLLTQVGRAVYTATMSCCHELPEGSEPKPGRKKDVGAAGRALGRCSMGPSPRSLVPTPSSGTASPEGQVKPGEGKAKRQAQRDGSLRAPTANRHRPPGQWPPEDGVPEKQHTGSVAWQALSTLGRAVADRAVWGPPERHQEGPGGTEKGARLGLDAAGPGAPHRLHAPAPVLVSPNTRPDRHPGLLGSPGDHFQARRGACACAHVGRRLRA